MQDLWPGQSVPLLKALHILTHNGGLNADSAASSNRFNIWRS